MMKKVKYYGAVNGAMIKHRKIAERERPNQYSNTREIYGILFFIQKYCKVLRTEKYRHYKNILLLLLIVQSKVTQDF